MTAVLMALVLILGTLRAAEGKTAWASTDGSSAARQEEPSIACSAPQEEEPSIACRAP